MPGIGDLMSRRPAAGYRYIEMAKVSYATPNRVTVELIPNVEYGGFTARVPDIPAYGEGATEDEAIADLREALLGYIEAFGLAAALAR